MGRASRFLYLRLHIAAAAFVLLTTGAVSLFAHAILVQSQPAAQGKVKGPSFPVVLTFNSRVDQGRSTMTLDGPERVSSRLAIRKEEKSPDKLLSAVADARPGEYKIRWQVLSVDGHITRGQIGFEVQ